MADRPHDAELVIRVVVVVTLGIVLLASVVCMCIVAVLTDRNLARAETYTFGGVILLTALGGVSWWSLRTNGRTHDQH